MKRTHIELFDDNSWNWTLSDASITGGILDITASNGYGQRSPDNNWYSGSNDDFVIEADVKNDEQDVTATYWKIKIKLVGDATLLDFDFAGGTVDKIRIHYPTNTIKASQSEAIDNLNWHSVKVRRSGTIFYLSVDGGSEISWDYGTARAIEYIRLKRSTVTGDYDNFKYYPVEIPVVGVGVRNPMII